MAKSNTECFKVMYFKSCYDKDPYVCSIYNCGHREILAKFRSGILPLSIESRNFQNIPREFRLCTICNDNVIEDETHLIFYCNQYNDLREYLYEKILPKYILSCMLTNNEEKW